MLRSSFVANMVTLEVCKVSEGSNVYAPLMQGGKDGLLVAPAKPS